MAIEVNVGKNTLGRNCKDASSVTKASAGHSLIPHLVDEAYRPHDEKDPEALLRHSRMSIVQSGKELY